jgi:hypothetical protein
MELGYEAGKLIIENKVVTALDRFVWDFTNLLEGYVNYVIVSGYVAILFGRARGTEDIDTIINAMDKSVFNAFYRKLLRAGYYCLNPEDEAGLYEMLETGLRVRIAKKDTIIPNIELLFVKDDFDRYALANRLEVVLDDDHVFISPLELQIAYKLYLGSDKDIEDAVYLWAIFKEQLELDRLRRCMDALEVRGDRYGIGV